MVDTEYALCAGYIDMNRGVCSVSVAYVFLIFIYLQTQKIKLYITHSFFFFRVTAVALFCAIEMDSLCKLELLPFPILRILGISRGCFYGSLSTSIGFVALPNNGITRAFIKTFFPLFLYMINSLLCWHISAICRHIRKKSSQLYSS